MLKDIQSLKETEQRKWEAYVDTFIIEFTGENMSHLLDSDENAGQRLRDWLKSYTSRLEKAIREDERERVVEMVGVEVNKLIASHNARVLNQFQLQGKPDMPIIAYDERVCLVPAITKVTEETNKQVDSILSLLQGK